jgi:hypothetical protein
MTRSELISIIALGVGVVLALTGVILAANGSPAGIWVLVAGVVFFGAVKLSFNIASIRRARRIGRLD